jgi:hypothetical protein
LSLSEQTIDRRRRRTHFGRRPDGFAKTTARQNGVRRFMTTKLATARELKAKIDRRISNAEVQWQQFRTCRASLPRMVPPDKVSWHGANWIPDSIENPVEGCEPFVM